MSPISNLFQHQANIHLSLEEKSWVHQQKFVDDDLCDYLSENLQARGEALQMSGASIGKGYSKNFDESIRKSFVSWIDDWQSTESLDRIHKILNEIMISLNRYFFLSMKRFESQFAIYELGDFYKLHLDQHLHSTSRQVSCILYLNDCPKGGELILYNKNSTSEIAEIIQPKRGSLVLFFSGQIYHEVKCVQSTRYSLTTWFRDDEVALFS